MSGWQLPSGQSRYREASCDYTTTSLRKEFVADVEAYIEDEPFDSVEAFVKDVVVGELEGAVTEAEARRIGRKLRELGYVE